MIKEEIKKILNSIKETDINTLIYRFDIPHEPLEEEIEALEAAIKLIEQEPSEDCISRQTALEPYKTLDDNDTISVWMIRKNIEQIPPISPQPRTGHWIRVDKNKVRCSECEIIHLIAQYPIGKIDWCPNCGTKMEGEEV